MQDQISFLGRGWSFPPSFSQSEQTVEMLQDEADIKSSLEILLSTAIGERVMQPDYGCDLTDLLFEPFNTSLKTLMIDRVKTAITKYEARINLKRVDLLSDRLTEGFLVIEVEYVVRSTNSRQNIVYPFYIGEATEVKQITPVTQL